jgi:hypothetical protein
VPKCALRYDVFRPLSASTISEVKNDHAHVITQDICNQFIEIKFSVGCKVSQPNYLLQCSTTMSFINKILQITFMYIEFMLLKLSDVYLTYHFDLPFSIFTSLRIQIYFVIRLINQFLLAKNIADYNRLQYCSQLEDEVVFFMDSSCIFCNSSPLS